MRGGGGIGEKENGALVREGDIDERGMGVVVDRWEGEREGIVSGRHACVQTSVCVLDSLIS